METNNEEQKKPGKSGICQKCGKKTDNLFPVYDSALEHIYEVCPECAEIIEVDNHLYAKTLLVGCAITFVIGLLVSFVALIILALC